MILRRSSSRKERGGGGQSPAVHSDLELQGDLVETLKPCKEGPPPVLL
jgi:hypothetical protein